MKIKPIKEISIQKINHRGNGEGYYLLPNGEAPPIKKEVEVPFTCGGDLIHGELGQKKKGIRQGYLTEIVTASPERIIPKCRHFAECGGCRLQHISYEHQLLFKESIVKNLFDFLDPAPEFLPILGCSSPWNYRNKMEFSFSQNKAGDRFLGLMMARGRVANLQECHLVNDWFAHALKIVRQWWESTSLAAYHPYKDTGALRTLTVKEGLSSGDRFVVLTVSGNPEFAIHKNEIASFVEAVKAGLTPETPGSRLGISLRIHQAIKGKPTEFFDMHLAGPEFTRETLQVGLSSLDFQISPAAFFQPNPRQAEKLFHKAIEMANIPAEAVIYDLFCGTGTIGICAAPLAKQVVGIELIAEAVYDARANAAANGLENITFLQGDVNALLKEINDTKRFAPPDLVFVDPPRAGLGDFAIETLLKILSPTILYISCNPQTQAEDVKKLSQHYKVSAIQPVDQFPQTPHIENIVLLIKI